ncbi:MAG: Amt family ammonium transporter [bacterium]|jgi:Amt family ammonium transporter
MFLKVTLIVTLLLLLQPVVYANTLEGLQDNLNLIWIAISAALVFLMQGGFLALETGAIRAKNTINVAIKNVSDFLFALIGFFIIGFAFMFGSSADGWIGTSFFFLDGVTTPENYMFFIFQVVFCGTAATIVSGAVAERMKFSIYIIASIVISIIIYPVSGHWIWGGAIGGSQGWLQSMKFLDFAGSTVVHSVGGWIGLAAAILVGVRQGRVNPKTGKFQSIPGHNLSISALGVIILWFGWFGFNGGSTLTADGSIAKILVNTNISAAFGGFAGFLLSSFLEKKPSVEEILNGILGGLVGITAGCNIVSPIGASIIGVTSGIVVYATTRLLIQFKVDDPVNVVPVHGFCGMWGTIALALFAPQANLPLPRFEQFLVQLYGTFVVFLWAFGTGFLLFWILKKLFGIRVSSDDEQRGLNVSEHDSKMSWLDTIEVTAKTIKDGDLSRKIPVEQGTEAGEVAFMINKLLFELQNISQIAHQISQGDLKNSVIPKSENDILGHAISTMLDKLQVFAHNISEASTSVNISSSDMGNICEQLQTSSTIVTQNIQKILSNSSDTSKNINALCSSINELSLNINQVANSSQTASDKLSNINQNVNKISSDVSIIADSSENIAQSLGEIAANTEEAKQISNQANESVQETIDSMEELKQASTKVNQIVNLINSITNQTNMLALNATIEAAGAGEHGKGFAVVASEIKDLANQTAHANSNTGVLMGTIQKLVTKSFHRTQSVQTIIQQLSKINYNIDQSVDQQTEVAHQLAQTIDNIAKASKSSANNIQLTTIELHEIANAVHDAFEAATISNTEASQASQKMNEMNQSIEEVTNNIHKIENQVQSAQKNSSVLSDTSDSLKESVQFFEYERTKLLN